MTSPASIDERAASRGIAFTRLAPSYLNLCARAGQLYLTSGHTSTLKGKVGAEVSVDEAKTAAVDSIQKVLSSVAATHGTLEGLRVVRLMACVNAAADFTEHGVVINAASDLVHEIFGMESGYHARSALGFASLPGGAAVEIEAVIEIVDTPAADS